MDSNGWLIRLSRMQNPGRAVWVESDPPKSDEVIRPQRYLVGLADAAAHGGRWVVSLDSAFRQAVAAKDAAALKEWARIGAAAKFFQARADREALPARAVLAVVSDFRGANEDLSHEILNLAARQQLPYLLIDKAKFTSLPPGLKAVIYADTQPPAPALRAAVGQFVEAGGLLIAGAVWGKPASAPLPDSPTVRYSVHPAGKGRIAMPKDQMDDPYLVAADAQLLLGHRHDVVRVWNGGLLGAYPTGDAKRTVLHLVNYGGRPGVDPVSIWIAGDFRTAMLHSFEFPEPRQLPIIRQRGGVEMHLPALAVYGAVEVSS